MPRFAVPALVPLLSLLLHAGVPAQQLTVKGERRGDLMVLDVELHVPASVADTWAVLTDFEHMPAFLPNIKASSVAARNGNTFELAQTAEARLGIFSTRVSSVRAVELVPMQEIRQHLISGDFKSYEATTRITPKGGETLLVHHGEYASKSWVPPMVGAETIEAEARKQYGQLVAEIVRRQTPGGGAKAAPSAASVAPAASAASAAPSASAGASSR